MGLKFVLVCALALLSCQATFAKEIAPIGQDGIIEELQQVFENLKAAVKEALTNAERIVWELYEKLVGQASEQIEAAIEEIKKIVEEVKKEIAEIEEAAKEISEEAKQCVVNEKDRVNELVNSTQKALQQCAKDSVAKGEDIINEAITELNGIKISIQDLIEEFGACSNIFCQIGVISKIGSTLTTIKNTVEEVVQSIAEFIQTEAPILQACQEKATVNFATELKAIVNDIRGCLTA